jgi:hypothetical protein
MAENEEPPEYVEGEEGVEYAEGEEYEEEEQVALAIQGLLQPAEPMEVDEAAEQPLVALAAQPPAATLNEVAAQIKIPREPIGIIVAASVPQPAPAPGPAPTPAVPNHRAQGQVMTVTAVESQLLLRLQEEYDAHNAANGWIQAMQQYRPRGRGCGQGRPRGQGHGKGGRGRGRFQAYPQYASSTYQQAAPQPYLHAARQPYMPAAQPPRPPVGPVQSAPPPPPATRRQRNAMTMAKSSGTRSHIQKAAPTTSTLSGASAPYHESTARSSRSSGFSSRTSRSRSRPRTLCSKGQCLGRTLSLWFTSALLGIARTGKDS